MEAVRIELRRLARGYARARGGLRAARWHLALLVAAIALALVDRAALALPLFDHLAGRWIPALIATVVLYNLGPLLRGAAAFFGRPHEDEFARSLDDRFAWRDATETALTLAPSELDRPVPAFLAAQTAGRLRDVRPQVFAQVKRPGRRRWRGRLLALLFLAMLLLPGVDGLLGRGGGGTTGDGVVGSRGPDDPVGAPRPMKADFWLQTFVQNPLKVEALPGGAEVRQEAKQAKDAKAKEQGK